MELKSREQKIRRSLDRLGYRLVKSRKQSGISQGLYMVVDIKLNAVVSSGFDGWTTLENIEDWLTS